MVRTYNKNGFTLVELAVVLIIIALLVAGVTQGNKILKSAKLRTVISDISVFTSAVENFRQQYNALPGDMANAHSFWDDGANGVCGTAAQCNGNGNRNIQWGNGPNSSESFRAWQHLSLSGILPGSYSGVAGSGGNNHADVGVSVPASRIKGGGYILQYGNWYGVPSRNGMQFGSATSNGGTINSIITSRDAYYIDQKMDDDSPYYGTVQTYKGNEYSGNDCTSGSGAATAYKLTENKKSCRMRFYFK